MGKVINFSGSVRPDNVKAFVIFNGSDASIIKSKNISSLTRISKGKFEIIFNIPFNHTNYIVLGSDVGSTLEGYHSALVSNGVSKETDRCQFKFVNDNGATYDLEHLQVCILDMEA